MIRFSAFTPALLTLGVWLAVGFFYLQHIQRFGPRVYLRRIQNYRHLSHVLVACQVASMAAGVGQLPAGGSLAPAVSWLGVFTLACGLALCLWAKGTLGPFWDRHASIQAGHQLVRSGPYGWCRNPIFLGQFGLFVGAGLTGLNAGALACCAAALLSFYYRIHKEERLLAEHFGREYAGYQAEVPRFWPVRKLRKALPEPAAFRVLEGT